MTIHRHKPRVSYAGVIQKAFSKHHGHPLQEVLNGRPGDAEQTNSISFIDLSNKESGAVLDEAANLPMTHQHADNLLV